MRDAEVVELALPLAADEHVARLQVAVVHVLRRVEALNCLHHVQRHHYQHLIRECFLRIFLCIMPLLYKVAEVAFRLLENNRVADDAVFSLEELDDFLLHVDHVLGVGEREQAVRLADDAGEVRFLVVLIRSAALLLVF